MGRTLEDFFMTAVACSPVRAVARFLSRGLQALCLLSGVVAGINFPMNAQRRTWTQIRGHLVTACGMTLPQ